MLHPERNNAPLFWKDWAFWLALGLGPLCWLILYVLDKPLRSASVAWQTLLLIAVVYPALEEYVFRGGLQAALYRNAMMARSIAGFSLANLVTSVIFAAVHLFNQPPLWAFLIFFPSLIFGWMRDRYQTIHASILLHMVYNAGFILLFSV